MRSRVGKKTGFDISILRGTRPEVMIKQHRREMRKLEARGPFKYAEPPKLPIDHEDNNNEDEELDHIHAKPKTDLTSYIKNFNLQKTLAVTQRSKSQKKSFRKP